MDDQTSKTPSGQAPRKGKAVKVRLDALRKHADTLAKTGKQVGPIWYGVKKASSQACLAVTGDDSLPWFQSAEGQGKEFEQRQKIQKALVKIEEEGFYTLGGIVSLIQSHYEKALAEAFEKSKDPSLTPDERKDWKDKHRALLTDTRSRLKRRPLTHQLRRLVDAAESDRLCRSPRGKRLTLIHDFMEVSGFLDSPVPLKWVKEKPAVLQSMLYAGAGSGDAVFHSMRLATGLDDPSKAFKDKETAPFAGAVYQSYVFDNPYLKRGVFVVRAGDLRGPIEVEYFEGWNSELQSRDYKALDSWVEQRTWRRQDPKRQRYEEYYRGYLVDQGFDSYVFLFGPQDPGLKFNDPYNALLAVKGLQKLIAKRSADASEGWDAKAETIADYLKGLDETYVINTLKAFLEESDDTVRQAQHDHDRLEEDLISGQGLLLSGPADAFDDGRPSGRARYRADFTGRATRETLLDTPAIANDPYLRHLSEGWDRAEPSQNLEAEAAELKKALWTLFEVEGRPAPKVGEARRIRTLYLEGANRNALTPNVLKGSVVAFDNSSKSEMLCQKTLMYRLGPPTTDIVELTNMTIMARNGADRFDMRQPDEDRDLLGSFEPKYREIFLTLGFDVAPTHEQHKPYRVDALMSNTASDAEELEVVLD